MRYVRDATVEHVTDGDTVALLIDLGWSLFARYACRIVVDASASIDTPERGQGGYAAAVEYARSLLTPGTRVVVESLRMTDKYGGRFDGTLTLPNGTDFAQAMVASGHARVWRVGEPKPFPRAGT